MELVIAGGILLGATVFAFFGWIALRKGTARARDVDRSFAEARAQLDELVAREVEQRTTELEQMLSRARADSLSQLAEEERRIAAERRSVVVEHEREAGVRLRSEEHTSELQSRQ